MPSILNQGGSLAPLGYADLMVQKLEFRTEQPLQPVSRSFSVAEGSAGNKKLLKLALLTES